jgi:hypothetical protein
MLDNENTHIYKYQSGVIKTRQDGRRFPNMSASNVTNNSVRVTILTTATKYSR